MILGIDLGTTNSLVGYFDGEVVLVKNQYGTYLTPSVIGVNEQGDIVIGQEALPYLLNGNAIKLFKREMGNDKKFVLGKHKYTPVELSAMLINKLIKDFTDHHTEEIEGLVISVPAYFNENQRFATRFAGELTGYPVLRIINEPTAAALYAKEVLDYNKFNSKYVIIDLGGGTLDLTVVEFFEGIFEIKAIAGDTNLGGENYTDILVDMFLHKYPNANREAVYNACEKEKKGLDVSEDSTIELSVGDNNLRVSFDEYYTECSIYNNKISVLLRKIITDSGVHESEFDHIIFVGGGSKSLAFRKFIYESFSLQLDNELFFLDEDSDLYIAYGVVMYTSIIKGISDYIITDICPFTLGTVTRNEIDKQQEYTPIINRNTTLPISIKRHFRSYKRSSLVNIPIYQGESFKINNNLKLGEMNIKCDPSEANGLQITFTYDINSLLEVTVYNETTKEEYVEVFHHNTDISNDNFKKIRKAFELQKNNVTDNERFQGYIKMVEFNYENCHISQRRYYGSLILECNKLLDSGSMIELRKFEKQLKEILNIK